MCRASISLRRSVFQRPIVGDRFPFLSDRHYLANGVDGRLDGVCYLGVCRVEAVVRAIGHESIIGRKNRPLALNGTTLRRLHLNRLVSVQIVRGHFRVSLGADREDFRLVDSVLDGLSFRSVLFFSNDLRTLVRLSSSFDGFSRLVPQRTYRVFCLRTFVIVYLVNGCARFKGVASRAANRAVRRGHGGSSNGGDGPSVVLVDLGQLYRVVIV